MERQKVPVHQLPGRDTCHSSSNLILYLAHRVTAQLISEVLCNVWSEPSEGAGHKCINSLRAVYRATQEPWDLTGGQNVGRPSNHKHIHNYKR